MADRKYWLMKSEPDVYSIDDLEEDGRTHWDGVRNYQARNLMRDDMEEGDRVLFYHSNASPPGVVGVAEVVKEGYPDHTARDPDSDYYDEKATEEDPRWYMVDIAFVRKLSRMVPLGEIKDEPALEDMVLVNRSRLSVQPVEEAEFERVLEMAEEESE
ncbi:MAG: EVE domain-containing protein [Longimicrobiales bacterium]|nr:EVE domain-containing protein [Longimicrobiales bacterium]